MQEAKGRPMVVPSGGGQRMVVLGNDVTLKIAGPESGEAYYLFEALTPPGISVPPHVHRHEDEVIQILEGALDVYLGGRTHKATQGSVINFPRFVPHGFANNGKTPCRAWFTVIPGTNFAKFFEELSALPVGAPPDMKKVAEIFGRYDIEILPLA